MKLNRIITLCAIATTLALSVGDVLAQQDNGNANDNNNGGQRRNRRLRQAQAERAAARLPLTYR